jgi:hypothetical protein
MIMRRSPAVGWRRAITLLTVQLDLQFVDATVGLDDAVGGGKVARLEAVDRHADLRLHQPAHLQDARADRFELLVVDAGGVFACCHGGSVLSRSGR